MLVQWTRCDVPGYDAAVRRLILRHPRFAIALLRTRGLVTDWAMQSGAVSFISRMRRTQLSVVLEGRGFFLARSGTWTLVPGDAVISDQSLGEGEGYAGSPCAALYLEWDDDTIFGPGLHGEARRFRLGRRDLAALRALASRIADPPHEIWALQLAELLRSMGLRATGDDDVAIAAPPALARVFALLGDAISNLDRHPQIGELAGSLALTERQTRRHVEALAHSYAHANAGWRDFINDARIGWAMRLLSLPRMPLARVAQLAGYRSTVALAHAFSLRGIDSPAVIARRLAERWG